MSKNDKMWHQNLQKVVKMTYILTYILINIGHSDLMLCMLIDIPNTINNYYTQRFHDQKWQNVPTKFSKSSKSDVFLTYICLNIGHVVLIFCMHIDISNTINNYHTQRFHDQKWQNIPIKFTDYMKNDLHFDLQLPKCRSQWPNFW